jgi:hypothetical protein
MLLTSALASLDEAGAELEIAHDILVETDTYLHGQGHAIADLKLQTIKHQAALIDLTLKELNLRNVPCIKTHPKFFEN